MLTEFAYLGESFSSCTSGCACSCQQADVTNGGGATVKAGPLSYNSQTQAHPVMMFALSASSFPEMTHMDVHLTVGSNSSPINVNVYFGPAPTSEGNIAADWVTFGIPINADSMPSGLYDWELNFTIYTASNSWTPVNPYHSDINSIRYQPLQVVNHDESPYGAGWSMIDDQRLMIQDGSLGGPAGVALVTGNDQLVWFPEHENNGVYTYSRMDNPYDFSELDKHLNNPGTSDDTYTLTSPDGTVRTFDYQGLLKTIEDRNGNTTTYTYGAGDKIASIVDASGRTTSFDYTDGLKITDFDGVTGGEQTTQYVYSGDQLTKMIQPDPDGAGPLTSPTTIYHYNNNNGLMDSIIDPRGLETTIAYDSKTRRVSSIVERCGGEIQVTSLQSLVAVDIDTNNANNWAELKPYHNALTQFNTQNNDYSFNDIEQLFSGKLTISGHRNDFIYKDPTYETRVAFGETTKIIRDRFGNIQYMQDANGAVTQFIRDANGLATQVVQRDPNNPSSTLTTNYSYNSDGQVTGVSHPIGSESWSYGDFGQLASYTDASGKQTTYDIDEENGNVLSMTQGSGSEAATTYYTYTDGSEATGIPKGLIKSVVDPNGNETRYEYDSDHHFMVETVTSGYGTEDVTTVTYEYDARDRVSTMTDGLGRHTDYTYDNLDRLFTQTDPDPDGNGPLSRPVTQFRYDAVGNQIAVTDPLGRVTESVFDVRNRPFQTIQPVADPSVTPTVITKDDNQQTSSTGSWSTTSRSGAYGGNVGVSTAASASKTYTFTGLSASKKYAALVRWVPSTTPDEYDTNALFQVFGDTGGDPLNELHVDLNRKTEGLADGSGYMWLSLGAFSPHSGSLTVKLTNGGTSDKLVIDGVRLVEVGPVTQTKYDCNGNLVKATDPLGNATTYEYDDLNRLIARTDPDPDGSGSTYTSPVTHYAYNSLGWMTSMVDAENNGTIYQYDSMGRQTKQINVLAAGLTGEYTDGSGNTKQVDSQVNFPDTGGALNGYSSVTWTGAIYLDDPGEVIFYLKTTDNAHLYIDDYSVMSYTSNTGMTESDATTIDLVAGWHTVKIEYHDGNSTGDNGLVVSWNPGSGKAAIPAAVFGTTQTTATTSYDNAGRVLASLDALGRSTLHDYDSLGRVETDSRLNFLINEYVYDGAGNLAAITDGLEKTTLYAYDALNRQTQVIQPFAGPSGTPHYDLRDETAVSTTGSWNASPTTNDSAYDDHVLEATAVGASATYTFDTGLDDGKTYAVLVHWAPASGDVEHDDYDTNALFQVYGDPLADPLGISRQNLNVPTQGYDSTNYGSMWKVLGGFHPDSGELSLVISDDDSSGLLAIDAVQLLEVGGVTTYTYDAASQLTSLTDPVGNTTSWVYDGLGRTLEENNELNGTRYYQYDAVGNVTRTIDRDGRITRYQYDHLNRQTKEIWQQETVGDKVKSRSVFYNNYQELSHDEAIAIDANGAPKQAVLPGESDIATVRGFINALMVDIVDVGNIGADDFSFMTSPTDSPTNWSSYSPTITVTVRSGEGKDGSDRVEITGLSVMNGWLKVMIDANSDTNLETDDVFYFGTQQGDANGDGYVDGSDFIAWQTNFNTASGGTWDMGDFNGDGSVDGSDFVIWQTNSPFSPVTLDTSATVIRTISYAYDAAGRLDTVTDRNGNALASADYDYDYDNLNRVKLLKQTLVGLTPTVKLSFVYDDLSRRTSQFTTIGGMYDFSNNYSYDTLGRMKSVVQSSYGGYVAQKHVDFTYNAAGQFDTITRYAAMTATNLVATSSYGYDLAGRLISLLHQRNNGSGLSAVADYEWTWDNASRITGFDFDNNYNTGHSGESAVYSYDNSGQIVGADYTSGSIADEGYSYDSNGNRIDVDSSIYSGATFDTGVNNRLDDDGTYTYEYDGEGNLIKRTETSSGDYRVLAWDHRNRLASVTDYNSSDVKQKR
ncbi:MAG: RHS repeat protein, partial [Pirellulales bacterium]|nr:RHS repeat protein [Pirellulales bacterium]